MGPEVDVFSKSLQAGGLGLVALLLWILYRIFGPWVAAKIEGEKIESKARVDALASLAISLRESAQAFQTHEVAAEKRHGTMLLHVEQATQRTEKSIRNALTLLNNGIELPEERSDVLPSRDREDTDPGRRRPARRGGG